ncbi:MAG: kelch repeat-containing protein [Bacteroidota bacterium]
MDEISIMYDPPIILEILPSVITSLEDTITISGLNFGKLNFNDFGIQFIESLSIERLTKVSNFPDAPNKQKLIFTEPDKGDFEDVILQGSFDVKLSDYGILEGEKIIFNIDGLFEFQDGFPGSERSGTANFKINDKFYFGLGSMGNGATFNDFWEYDITNKTWRQVANFPGSKRRFASATQANGFGYVGLGETNVSMDFEDIYRFDPQSNSWEFLTNHPEGARSEVGFFIKNEILYACSGGDNQVFTFDLNSENWTQIANFPENSPRVSIAENQNMIFALSRGLYQFENESWTVITNTGFNSYKHPIADNNNIYTFNFNIIKIALNDFEETRINLPDLLEVEAAFEHQNTIHLFSNSGKVLWTVDASKL